MPKTYIAITELFYACCILFTLSSTSSASSLNQNEQPFFDDYFGDLQEELKISRENNKKGLLIMWTIHHCPWCDRMERDVFSVPEVHNYFKRHFRIIKIDENSESTLIDFKGNETTEKAFAIINRARVTPMFVFYDTDGIERLKFIGMTKNYQQFMLLGKYVVDQEYNNEGMTFVRYENKLKTSR